MNASTNPITDEGSSAAIDSVERLLSLTAEEVDDLPYGFIILDAEGTILLYNRYESALARTTRDSVLGRNFFRDVAPCTRVNAFFGRFRAIASGEPGATGRFAFRFHFLHGAQDVRVQITRAPDVMSADGDASAGARLFLTVARVKVASSSNDRPEQVRLDLRGGRVTGPLGPTLPLSASVLHLSLRRLGEPAARELGREMGRDIAELAQRSIVELARLAPGTASPQLVAGALDDVLAGAGLGRLALDFTQHAELGVIGCTLRPPIDLPERAFAAFYEGLLSVTMSALLDLDLVARCLDTLDLTPTPWLFTLGASPASTR